MFEEDDADPARNTNLRERKLGARRPRAHVVTSAPTHPRTVDEHIANSHFYIWKEGNTALCTKSGNMRTTYNTECLARVKIRNNSIRLPTYSRAMPHPLPQMPQRRNIRTAQPPSTPRGCTTDFDLAPYPADSAACADRITAPGVAAGITVTGVPPQGLPSQGLPSQGLPHQT